MTLLPNTKHELFAQGMAKGLTLEKAYEEAGYKPNRANASRLTTNDNIKKRIEEIRETATATVIEALAYTTETAMLEVEEARQMAMKLGQSSAAIAATRLKADLLGLIVKKQESGAPGDFSKATDDELRAGIAADLAGAQPPAADPPRPKSPAPQRKSKRRARRK